ncbi:helix-turn-helix transcriptional regulator [Streptomyces laculatispora]|nr:helix-turn-helix transcriptional regulator [Streptomyces laculatispora]
MRRGWCRGSAPGPAPHTLFTTRGYAAPTTRAVAERAGMGQATMYHYVAGEQDLPAALLESTVAPSPALAGELLAEGSRPAEESLRGVRGGHGGCGDSDRGGAGVAEAPPPHPRSPDAGGA